MNDTVELTKELIARASITPNDAGCQTIIANRLKKTGFSIEFFEIEGVTNLWARFGQQNPLLVLAGHTDVVTPGDISKWQYPPFEATESGEWLYGRGVADMKGGLAAMITACERFLIKQTPQTLKGSLAFLITSDEEGPSLYGTKAVLEKLKERNEIATWCLVGEPSSEKTLGDTIKVGRRGSITGFLKLYGKQGHVAYPHLALNPIHQATTALSELLSISWPKANDLFPQTSLQIVNIQSGTGSNNVIPSELEATFNVRFSPPLTAELIKEQIISVLNDQKIHYGLQWHTSGGTFYTETDSPLVNALIHSVEKHRNITPKCCTKGGTSDGRFFAPYGTQVAELGLINDTIHQVNERAAIRDLTSLSEIYEGVLHQLLI